MCGHTAQLVPSNSIANTLACFTLRDVSQDHPSKQCQPKRFLTCYRTRQATQGVPSLTVPFSGGPEAGSDSTMSQQPWRQDQTGETTTKFPPYPVKVRRVMNEVGCGEKDAKKFLTVSIKRVRPVIMPLPVLDILTQLLSVLIESSR